MVLTPWGRSVHSCTKSCFRNTKSAESGLVKSTTCGPLGRGFSEHGESSQLRVLRFGLLQDGDVRVGVFPESEEVLIRSACFGASGFCSGGLRFEGVGAFQS